MRTRWRSVALLLIVAGSAALYAWNIGSAGWGNTFYTAAVKSMSQSLTNFVFGSFDPAGVVTVDKPPMALWPQVFAVWIFGWHSWAILLPQVLEGAGAVFLLHRTVRRWAGENVALLAALVLALSPVTVAIDRNNNPDTLLMLLCVAAAYAFTRSLEAGTPARSATRWLLQAAFWVGCGFLTKSLAAWMIIPVLGLGYLFGTRSPWRRRVGDLLLAGGVLLVSSFWWVLLTVVWPSPKPYVGGSTDGGELSLIFGYNGLGRVFGENMGHGGAAGPAMVGGQGAAGGAFRGFAADTGLGRMFGQQVGGQISWLIPLCLLALGVVAVTGLLRWREKLPADHQRRAGWLMWGAWLIVLGLVFSFQQGIFHPYYTTQLSPAVAALSAAGLALLWRRYRDPSGYSWLLLPAGIAVTAAWAWVVVSRDPSWNGWLRYTVAAPAVVAVVGLTLVRRTQRQGSAPRVAMALGLVAVLLAPAVWSTATAFAGTGGPMASAGPPGGMFGGHARGPRQSAEITLPNGQHISRQQAQQLAQSFGRGQASLSAQQRKILAYVTGHSGTAKITLAVEGGAMAASNYIINSDATIIGMGGFMGGDPAPNTDQLTQWKTQGDLAFVLTSTPGTTAGMPGGNGRFGRGGGVAQQRIQWVQHNCAVVAPTAYGESTIQPTEDNGSGFPGFGGAQMLYDCRSR